ncbi:MAG: pyrimidine dimer DNA glycosylase/endonuclease V [Patescibacteria group bacterium]
MRIWDVDPKILCQKHLVAEHRELHAVWIVITKNRNGYSRHPETLRWHGKLAALYYRHERLVREFTRRGYRHYTPLNKKLAIGNRYQLEYIDDPSKQLKILKAKPCGCPRQTP